MTKILLSENKIKELEKTLLDMQERAQKQRSDQARRGGASDSWHETAAFAATQAAFESKLSEIESILSKATILPKKIDSDKVVLGSWVRFKSEAEQETLFRIVHPLEADPTNKLLSIKSPLGKELLGKRVGGKFSFNEMMFEIKEIF